MKRKLIALLSIVLASSAAVGVGFTVAGFVGKAKVDAPIGERGVLGTYLFLDTGTWTEEAGGADFCINCWIPGSPQAHYFFPSKATTTEGYLVFNVDMDLFNGGGFQFVRYNSSTPISSLTWSYAKDIIYNVSISYGIVNRAVNGADGKNLYRISGWGTNHFHDDAGHDLGTIAAGSWAANYIDS